MTASLRGAPEAPLAYLLERVFTGRGCVSVAFSRDSSRAMVVVAVPVRIGGRFQGVLAGLIPPDFLSRFLDGGEVSSLSLKSGGRLILARGDDRAKGDGRRLIVARSVFRDSGWELVATRDLTAVLGDLRKKLLLAFAAVLPVFGMFLLLARRLASFVSEFLLDLASMIFQVASGKTGQRAHAGGKNELSVLARAYNTMAAFLERTRAELSERLEILERQKVRLEEQTRELAALQEELYQKQAELVKKNQMLQEMLVVDQLTGLYNRHAFLEMTRAEIKRSFRYREPLVLALIDIDYFKTINDTYGHSVGDQVLCEVAKVFKNTVRHSDLAGRYGGDELILLAPNTNLTSGCFLAERIRENVSEHQVEIGGRLTGVTVSVGLASLDSTRFPSSEKIKDAEVEVILGELLERADRGLYLAKNRGRNRVEAC